MKRATLVFLFAAIAGCERPAPPPPAPTPAPPTTPSLPPVRKRISLQVDASTWRTDQKPLDIAADLIPLLRASGVDASGTASTDGSLRVDYRETKGVEYLDTFNQPAGSGTEIKLTLTVQRPGAADRSLVLEGSAGMGAVGGLYEASVANLRRGAGWKHAGDFVASALGVTETLPDLVPALYDESVQARVAELFQSVPYQPATRADQAQLLVVQARYEDCVALGEDAVGPLLARLERGMIPEYETRIAEALGRIGDPRPARAMLDKAKDRANFAFADAPLIVALLAAVGETGDASMIPELEQLAGSDEARVAEAARAAKAAIEKRR